MWLMIYRIIWALAEEDGLLQYAFLQQKGAHKPLFNKNGKTENNGIVLLQISSAS